MSCGIAVVSSANALMCLRESLGVSLSEGLGDGSNVQQIRKAIRRKLSLEFRLNFRDDNHVTQRIPSRRGSHFERHGGIRRIDAERANHGVANARLKCSFWQGRQTMLL